MSEVATKEITVQGFNVTVAAPYTEGHTITEAEAKALNQVRAENIRNNCASKIKKEAETLEGPALEKFALDLVAEYDAGYEFTLASVGGGSSARLDPIEKEARAVAKAVITGQLKDMGITQKAYCEQHGEDAIKNKVVEFAENPKIIEIAKKNLKEREKTAGLASDLQL
jgi:hypothetical protein